MDYLTKYYKTRSEQLQEELDKLNENVFDDAYHLYHYLFSAQPNQMRNRVPYGTIDRPGRKPKGVNPYRRPAISGPDGIRPMYPPGLDPGTDNGKDEPQWYPGPDVGGQPYGPGPYPYYYNPDGSISTQEVRPVRR
jgi:hypothetical protein